MKGHPCRFLWICALALPLLSGCAVFNRDNTPTLNFVHDHLMPDTAPSKYLAMPLVLPAGLVAVVADMLIVHPITVADDAFYDTGVALWSSMDWKNRYATESAVVVPRAVLSPVVFVACFLGRSCFDIPPHGAAKLKPPRRTGYSQTAADLIADARKAYGEGRFDDGLAMLAKAKEADSRCAGDTIDLQVACLARLHRDQEWMRLWTKDFAPTNADLLPDMANEAAGIMREGSPTDKMRLLVFLDRRRIPALTSAVADVFPPFISGDDRALAMCCIISLGTWTSRSNRDALMKDPPDGLGPKALQLLESAARSDDPMIAAAARVYLDRLEEAAKAAARPQPVMPQSPER